MKCDELKPIDLECNMGKDVNGVEHREPWKAYDIDEVNAAIAELKARITQLEKENAQLKENRQEWIDRAYIAVENLVKLEKELPKLREATRWRKCPDELPEDEERVLVFIDGKVEKVKYRKFDGSFHNAHFSLLNHSVKWWLPMPKAPVGT